MRGRPAPPRPAEPEWLGPYRLRRRLGAGGMGVVYLGDHAGSPVAIKVLRPELAADPAFRARFRREVEAAARVAGARTARVLDADGDGPSPYLVTEYVEGPTLCEAVASGGPFRGRRLASLAAGVAEALAAIHAHGLVHRDLKPSNVLLSPTGPKVIDFGIARAVDATALTRTGLRFGTPAWMAPEQLQDHPVTPAADVFAWGGLVAFAATGRPPFGSGAAEAVAYRIIHEAPQLGALPGPLRTLVEAALAKDPGGRPPARELLHRLDGATAPVEVTPVEAASRTRAGGPGQPGARTAPTAPGTPARPLPGWSPSTPRRRGRRLVAALFLLAAMSVVALSATPGLVLAVDQPRGPHPVPMRESGSGSSPDGPVPDFPRSAHGSGAAQAGYGLGGDCPGEDAGSVAGQDRPGDGEPDDQRDTAPGTAEDQPDHR